MPASSWKTVWWSRSDEQAKQRLAVAILAQRQPHPGLQVQKSSQGCWPRGCQARYHASDNLHCAVSSPAAWAGPVRLTVHTQRKESRRAHRTQTARHVQRPGFQPDCESSSWAATTDAADIALEAGPVDNNLQVLADMTSSSFQFRSKPAAAAANIVKEQTVQALHQQELAGAS